MSADTDTSSVETPDRALPEQCELEDCTTADDTVRWTHLAPLGNLIAVAACEGCRRRWGTLAPPAEVGAQGGLIVDGFCPRCPPETQGGHERLNHVEQEFQLAGYQACISVTLCPQHARQHGESFLTLGGDR